MSETPGRGFAEADALDCVFGYTIGKDKVTGNKMLRADPFSIQVNNGNVRAAQGPEWWAATRDQLSLFPFGSLKDIVDAASGAFAVLTNKVQVGTLPRRPR